MTSKELKNKPLVFGAHMTSSVGNINPDINDIFGLISGTSSKLKKEEFLKEHMNPVIGQILQDTYGGRKYFVKQYEVLGSGELTLDRNYKVFRDLLDDLAARKITGNDAKIAVGSCIEQFRPCDQIWLARILDGNLKIGAGQTFSEDSGTIDKYPCALANVLEKAKNVDVLDGNWLASRKLDGCVDYYSYIEFEDGRVLPIGEVVKNQIKGRIKSWDGEKVIFCDIEDYFEGIPDVDVTQKEWYELELDNGKKLKITANDRIMTQHGWKRVDELTCNDAILTDV